MPKASEAPEGPGAFHRALRDPGRGLKERFQKDPVGLAERFGLILPEKPTQVMRKLGLWNDELQERWGDEKPGLREMVESVCLGTEDSVVGVGPRGGGKALSVNTPVATPEGWTTMGALRVGDRVFGASGLPCTVTKAYAVRRNRPCYEMVFSDRTSIVADEDHLWFTQTVQDRWKGHEGSARTTGEIRATLRHGGRQDSHHQIQNARPLWAKPRRFVVHPYLLGLWLGDGDSTQGIISVGKADVDVVQAIIERDLCRECERIPDNNGNSRLRVKGLTVELREMGVLKNKHVPEIYLRSSENQRMQLLAGLMDSDGTTRSTNNNCQFDNTNERLADAAAELVVSLGLKCTRGKRAAKLYGVEHGVCHKVSFRPDRQVFWNPRKAKRLNFAVGQSSRHKQRVIHDVRPVPSVPVRCIEVDSPDHLFLAGSQMVPTHNSQGVSFIEFFLWLLKDFDCINLGGSEQQANNVYQYLLAYLDHDKYWRSLVKGDPMISESTSVEKAFIKVLTASQKQTRAPHAGGKKAGRAGSRGGLLVIDEEAEADPEIVRSALPTINTATPSVCCRVSTFHKIGGTFQEVVDDHAEMGFRLYTWDTFDVCAGCECSGGPTDCQSEEPCFREDHYEDFIDPDTGELEHRLVHKAFCGGRAKYARGWVLMAEIVKLWRRLKRNHSVWEVEAMGSRPSTKGYVVKAIHEFNSNIVEDPAASLYVPGMPATICIDWGTVAAAVTVWQMQFREKKTIHVLLHADELHETGETEIFNAVLGYARKYRAELSEVAADIGGGGSYFNPDLEKKHRLPVRGVNFNQEKEAAVAVFNIWNEDGAIEIPSEHTDFIRQIRKWRRNSTGNIIKGDDHLCDSAVVCYFSKFIDPMNLGHLRVVGKGFHAGEVRKTERPSVREQMEVRTRAQTGRRRALVRSFGSGRARKP